MPTIRRSGPYRLFLFSNEGSEPPHVHVQRDGALAKVWLAPVALASSSSFSARQLNRIERLVAEHQDELKEAWRDFFHAE